MYGMRKTTLYLPDDLKRSVERIAREEQTSEAEVLRSAVREAVARRGRPRPTIPLWPEGVGPPDLAERVDEYLAKGFGRDGLE